MPWNAVSLRTCAVVAISCVLIACGGGGSGGVQPSKGNAQVDEGGGAGASPPVIRGTPSTSVAVGQSYSFQPTARSANGGSLTFSAQNLPSWLTLDPATGRIYGTPTAADIGTYTGIVILVSDGSATARLDPFSISVVANGNGAATISWLPPTENSDGSALTDLAGFILVYGRSSTQLNLSITIDNPSVTTYVVENLTSGRWYFAVHALNSRGAMSERSAIASKTIS